MNAAGPALEELTVGQAILILAAIGAVFEGIRRAWPFARDFVRFLIEIVGAPERNGLPARPGLVETVRSLGEHLAENTARLTRVEESAAASASAVAALEGRIEHVSEQLDEVKATVEDVKDSQIVKAAELTQIRTAVEELRERLAGDATDGDKQGQS